MTFEYDSEPFGKERDAAIMKMAKEAGVEVVTENSHTLYDLDRYMSEPRTRVADGEGWSVGWLVGDLGPHGTLQLMSSDIF